MTLTAQIYLSFNGTCEAAFRFYEERLGATSPRLFTYGQSPMGAEVPHEWHPKIMHGSVTLGGLKINGADVGDNVPPGGAYKPPQGFEIFLEVDDPAETERLFNGLAENATIVMPLQQTFWSLRFGVLKDQFGIPWTLSCAQMPEGT